MNRRDFLQSTAFASSLIWTPGLFAEQLIVTPAMTEGPFYPDRFPLDTDNDLLILNDSLTPAVGEITHLTGRVLNLSGEPVRNAFVEIWQCDHNGAYLHSRTGNKEKQDANFQGYGRFLTDSKGNYYFRTIKPVPYPGRTPHIHVGVSRNGHRVLTTQLYVKGHPQNEKDGVLRGVRDPHALESVMGDFQPVPGSKFGELAVHFDIILGMTPDEGLDPTKGISKSELEMRRGRRPERPAGEDRPPRE